MPESLGCDFQKNFLASCFLHLHEAARLEWAKVAQFPFPRVKYDFGKVV